MEALTIAGTVLVALVALLISTVRRRARAQRRTAGRAMIHFPALADPAAPGPDMGTLSWLIWDGLNR
jgi:hypothetical protein